MFGTGFPSGSEGKESACNAGDLGSVPELGRFLGGGHGNPLQHLAWRIPMDRGAWRAAVQGIARVRHDRVAKHCLVYTYSFLVKWIIN